MSMSTAELMQEAPLRADHKIQVRFEEVTPEKALIYLERNKNNRGMRQAAVQAYARDLAAGAWQVTGEAIKFDCDGRLIDGQHRLQAIVVSDHSAMLLIVEGLDPKVQNVIDVNVRRNAADALRLLGVETNVFEVASFARLALLRESGQLNTYGTAAMRISHTEIHRWVIEHPEALGIVGRSRQIYLRIGASPSPLAYTIWALEQIDTNDAIEFFDSLSNFSTAGKGDPRQALLRALLAHRESTLGRRPGAQIGLIFSAWNGWRDKQSIDYLPLVDSKNQLLRIPDPI